MNFKKLFGIDVDPSEMREHISPLDKILSSIEIPTLQQTNSFCDHANEQLMNVAIPEFFQQNKVEELALVAEGKNKIVKKQLLVMYDGTVAKARQALFELVGNQKYQGYADRFFSADAEFQYPKQNRNQSSQIHFQYTGKKGPEKKVFDFMSMFASEKPVEFGDFVPDFQEPQTVFEQPYVKHTPADTNAEEYADYEIIDEQPDIETKNIEFNKAVSKMIDDLKAKKEINGLKAIVQSKKKSVDGGNLELTQETIDKARSALTELGVQ